MSTWRIVSISSRSRPTEAAIVFAHAAPALPPDRLPADSSAAFVLLAGVSKRGDSYLRSLHVYRARSVFHSKSPIQWAIDLALGRPKNVTSKPRSRGRRIYLAEQDFEIDLMKEIAGNKR
jgi:hypothetical protein